MPTRRRAADPAAELAARQRAFDQLWRELLRPIPAVDDGAPDPEPSPADVEPGREPAEGARHAS